MKTPESSANSKPKDNNFKEKKDTDLLSSNDNISLNINLSKLSRQEQFYFVNFLFDKTDNFKDDENILKLKKFCEKYKENGFRTFFSIEQGGKGMGDEIIALGEKLPKRIAEKVFGKYGEIVNNVKKITEFAKNNFKK